MATWRPIRGDGLGACTYFSLGPWLLSGNSIIALRGLEKSAVLVNLSLSCGYTNGHKAAGTEFSSQPFQLSERQ